MEELKNRIGPTVASAYGSVIVDATGNTVNSFSLEFSEGVSGVAVIEEVGCLITLDNSYIQIIPIVSASDPEYTLSTIVEGDNMVKIGGNHLSNTDLNTPPRFKFVIFGEIQ